MAYLCERGHSGDWNILKELSMLDVIFLVLGTGLFFLAAAYVRFCERL